MGASNFLETSLLNHIFNDPSYTPPTNVFVALCSAAPVETDTGSTITEVSYTGYGRVSTASTDWNAASAANPSTKNNGNAITFGQCTSGSDTATHFGLLSASTAGDLLLFGMLATGQGTCFFDSSDDIVDAPAHGFSADDRVVFLGETLPTGVSADTNYHIISTNLTTDQFQFSTSQGGSAVNFSTDGFGRFGETAWLNISLNITPEFAATALVVSMS